MATDFRIEELVDAASTANWRRRIAADFPENAARSIAAAEILDRIADEIPLLNGTELHYRLLDKWWVSADDSAFVENIDEALRSVGFGSSTSTARDLLARLI